MLILDVTPQDQASLLKVATTAIEAQVMPVLDEEGRSTMRSAQARESNRVVDKAYYSAAKAVVDDQITGYVAWTSEGKVAHLYVDPTFQGIGIGGALLRHAIAEIPGQQIHLRASINSVGFYEKLGFAPLDGELGDAGIRYVPMSLSVNIAPAKASFSWFSHYYFCISR